jgi:hypothetical protein
VPPDADEDFDPVPIIDRLASADADFVVIGGVAGAAHGSAYGTADLDIAYGRGHENLERIASVLRSLEARLRGAPPDVPFLLDAETLEVGGNFSFGTKLGSLDLLADPAGAAPYDALRDAAMVIEVRGHQVRVASLDHLIAMKEATGRPRDIVRAQELRMLSDELRAPPTSG